MQDAAQADTPVRNHPQRIVPRLQRVEGRHHIRECLPACVLVELLGYQASQLVQASFIMFLHEGAQKVGVVISPEGVDVILAGPHVTPLARLTVEEIIGLVDTFLQLLQIDVQIDLPAYALAYFSRRGVGVKQGKTGVEKNGANRLWLFKQHYDIVPSKLIRGRRARDRVMTSRARLPLINLWPCTRHRLRRGQRRV